MSVTPRPALAGLEASSAQQALSKGISILVREDWEANPENELIALSLNISDERLGDGMETPQGREDLARGYLDRLGYKSLLFLHGRISRRVEELERSGVTKENIGFDLLAMIKERIAQKPDTLEVLIRLASSDKRSLREKLDEAGKILQALNRAQQSELLDLYAAHPENEWSQAERYDFSLAELIRSHLTTPVIDKVVPLSLQSTSILGRSLWMVSIGVSALMTIAVPALFALDYFATNTAPGALYAPLGRDEPSLYQYLDHLVAYLGFPFGPLHTLKGLWPAFSTWFVGSLLLPRLLAQANERRVQQDQGAMKVTVSEIKDWYEAEQIRKRDDFVNRQIPAEQLVAARVAAPSFLGWRAWEGVFLARPNFSEALAESMSAYRPENPSRDASGYPLELPFPMMRSLPRDDFMLEVSISLFRQRLQTIGEGMARETTAGLEERTITRRQLLVAGAAVAGAGLAWGIYELVKSLLHDEGIVIYDFWAHGDIELGGIPEYLSELRQAFPDREIILFNEEGWLSVQAIRREYGEDPLKYIRSQEEVLNQEPFNPGSELGRFLQEMLEARRRIVQEKVIPQESQVYPENVSVEYENPVLAAVVAGLRGDLARERALRAFYVDRKDEQFLREMATQALQAHLSFQLRDRQVQRQLEQMMKAHPRAIIWVWRGVVHRGLASSVSHEEHNFTAKIREHGAAGVDYLFELDAQTLDEIARSGTFATLSPQVRERVKADFPFRAVARSLIGAGKIASTDEAYRLAGRVIDAVINADRLPELNRAIQNGLALSLKTAEVDFTQLDSQVTKLAVEWLSGENFLSEVEGQIFLELPKKAGLEGVDDKIRQALPGLTDAEIAGLKANGEVVGDVRGIPSAPIPHFSEVKSPHFPRRGVCSV